MLTRKRYIGAHDNNTVYSGSGTPSFRGASRDRLVDVAYSARLNTPDRSVGCASRGVLPDSGVCGSPPLRSSINTDVGFYDLHLK